MTASPAMADTAPTSTTLTLATNTVFSGLEDLDQIRVDVSGGNGNPAGSFGIFIGQTILCSGAITNGSGACNLAPNQLPPGSHPLTAIYNGDENSGASASNTENLTVVAQQPTTTTLTLSASTVTLGQEQTEQLAVRVTPVLDGIPTGTVTITAGSATVCTIALEDGDDSCALTASQLPAGSYQLTATYGGGPLGEGRDGAFAGSASAAQALTVVAPQPTTTTLTLSNVVIRFGHEQTEHLTVQVTPAGSDIPTGTATITADSATGSATVCTITLAGGTGSCMLTATQLPPGIYQLTGSYGGDVAFSGSTSASKTLIAEGLA